MRRKKFSYLKKKNVNIGEMAFVDFWRVMQSRIIGKGMDGTVRFRKALSRSLMNNRVDDRIEPYRTPLFRGKRN